MFRNRHLNFGYLLVILVVFAISISASCKLAYADGGPNGAISIRFDLIEGTPIDELAVGLPPTGSPLLPVAIPGKPEAFPPQGPKKIIPCIIVTHKGSNCISFYILGKQYEYCLP